MSQFNPFTWDNSSAFVRSHVLSLVLKDHRGETLMVKDSTDDVELKITRDGLRTPASVDSFFIKPSSVGKMQYHKIYLRHADGNAVRLRVSITVIF